jgi:hypothetical protein
MNFSSRLASSDKKLAGVAPFRRCGPRSYQRAHSSSGAALRRLMTPLRARHNFRKDFFLNGINDAAVVQGPEVHPRKSSWVKANAFCDCSIQRIPFLAIEDEGLARVWSTRATRATRLCFDSVGVGHVRVAFSKKRTTPLLISCLRSAKPIIPYFIKAESLSRTHNWATFAFAVGP